MVGVDIVPELNLDSQSWWHLPNLPQAFCRRLVVDSLKIV